MQASLRSTNYQQYYDFGPTLDCSTRHLHQHIDPSEQITPQIPIQIHHHHHQVVHHQQLIEDSAVSNTNFDQQHQHQQQSIETNNYLSSSLQQRSDELSTPNIGIHESLILYQDQQRHNHHFQQVNSVDNVDNNNNQGSHEEAIDSEARESIYHHQQSACVNINQHQQHQQHHHQQQTYQTIYYEPINFNGSCTIEAQENGNHQSSEPQNQTFVQSQLLSFVNNSQPPDEGCGVYFQYQEAHVANDEPLLSSDQSESELALPLVEQNQQQHQQRQQKTSFYDGDQTGNTNKQPAQTYQTLETITNSYDLNHLHHHFDQQVDLTSTNNDQQQQRHQHGYEPQQQQAGLVKSESPYQLHTNLHHHNHHDNHIQFSYIHSESTDASTITQSRDHSITRTTSSPHSSAASTISSSESEESFASTLTRDEKRAREANIPLTYYQIVNLSIDQFNEQLAKHNLSESQLTLIKDIRRRGKNKVAAQSCRKRKMEQINELQHEVNSLANKRRLLSCECSQLIKDHGNLVQEYDKIYKILQDKMQASHQNLQQSFQ